MTSGGCADVELASAVQRLGYDSLTVQQQQLLPETTYRICVTALSQSLLSCVQALCRNSGTPPPVVIDRIQAGIDAGVYEGWDPVRQCPCAVLDAWGARTAALATAVKCTQFLLRIRTIITDAL